MANIDISVFLITFSSWVCGIISLFMNQVEMHVYADIIYTFANSIIMILLLIKLHGYVKQHNGGDIYDSDEDESIIDEYKAFRYKTFND